MSDRDPDAGAGHTSTPAGRPQATADHAPHPVGPAAPTGAPVGATHGEQAPATAAAVAPTPATTAAAPAAPSAAAPVQPVIASSPAPAGDTMPARPSSTSVARQLAWQSQPTYSTPHHLAATSPGYGPDNTTAFAIQHTAPLQTSAGGELTGPQTPQDQAPASRPHTAEPVVHGHRHRGGVAAAAAAAAWMNAGRTPTSGSHANVRRTHTHQCPPHHLTTAPPPCAWTQHNLQIMVSPESSTPTTRGVATAPAARQRRGGGVTAEQAMATSRELAKERRVLRRAMVQSEAALRKCKDEAAESTTALRARIAELEKRLGDALATQRHLKSQLRRLKTQPRGILLVESHKETTHTLHTEVERVTAALHRAESEAIEGRNQAASWRARYEASVRSLGQAQTQLRAIEDGGLSTALSHHRGSPAGRDTLAQVQKKHTDEVCGVVRCRVVWEVYMVHKAANHCYRHPAPPHSFRYTSCSANTNARLLMCEPRWLQHSRRARTSWRPCE